jgi:hypothetical protein
MSPIGSAAAGTKAVRRIYRTKFLSLIRENPCFDAAADMDLDGRGQIVCQATSQQTAQSVDRLCWGFA